MSNDARDLMTLLRDVVATMAIALLWAAVAWGLPFAGVPIIALFAAPAGLVALAAFAWTPPLIGSFRVSLRRGLAGGLALLLGGQLTAAGTFWGLTAAHATLLAVSRGTASWFDAALAMAPWLLALLVPWALLVVGLCLARGLRVGWAMLAAAVVVGVAPATAHTMALYAWLGLPMSA